jgi:hypothetical protein
MAKLTDIKNCHVCGSIDIMPMEGVLVTDFYTDEEIRRTVIFCNECETIHYIEDGTISYEFSCKINNLTNNYKHA